MRKTSQAKSAIDTRVAGDHMDDPPRRVHGATVTSWNDRSEVDPELLLPGLDNGPTVSGVAAPACSRPTSGTDTLPDGSRITFVSTDQFGSVSGSL